ncbi:hypothetical protein D3C80_1320500 [compost metagenome]
MPTMLLMRSCIEVVSELFIDFPVAAKRFSMPLEAAPTSETNLLSARFTVARSVLIEIIRSSLLLPAKFVS